MLTLLLLFSHEHAYAAARLNIAKAFYNQAVIVSKKAEYAKAVELYIKSAEKGFAPAQFDLGDHYYFGQGVQENLALAIHWYHKAAEQGYTEAQEKLAWCYTHGIGVEKNSQQASLWQQRADKDDNTPLQLSLHVEDTPKQR